MNPLQKTDNRLDEHILLAFSYYYLHDQFDKPVKHPKLHMEMWQLFCSPVRRAAIAAPRSHAKSTAITLVYVLGNLCFREANFVVIAANNEDTSKLFVADLKKQFRDNQKLRQDFQIDQVHTFETDTTTDFIVNFQDGHQARIMGRGANQPIRGAKWGNKRPDLIIGDDLEDPKDVMNPRLRRELDKRIRADYDSAMSVGGRIRIVGTILHSDSLLEGLMPENQVLNKEDLVYEPLKTYTTGKPTVWASIRYKAHPSMNDFSSILWEEHCGEEFLRDMQASFMQKNDPEGYAQEYLSQPIDESRAFFDRTGLRPMDDADWKEPVSWYCGVDLAVSEKQSADYSAFVVAGYTSRNELLVVEVVKAKIEADLIIEQFFRIRDCYKDIVFFMEKGPISKTLEPLLYKEMSIRNKFFQLSDVYLIADKQTKARPLQHRIKAKAVKFDQEAPWYGDLEIELRQFPRGKHDDQIDALALIPLQIQYMEDGEQIADGSNFQADEDTEEEDTETFSLYDNRSSITGY